MRVDPPLKIEKIFFAFLDELDHSTHFKNCMEIDLGLTPSPPTGMEISIHFFVFLLCMVPLSDSLYSVRIIWASRTFLYPSIHSQQNLKPDLVIGVEYVICTFVYLSHLWDTISLMSVSTV